MGKTPGFRQIRSVFIFLVLGGLVYSLVSAGHGGLFGLSLTLAIIWLGDALACKVPVSLMCDAASKHEDLLCLLWAGNELAVRFPNGDSYMAAMKKEGNQTTHYETQEIVGQGGDQR